MWPVEFDCHVGNTLRSNARMIMTDETYPRKTRDLHNMLMNSTRWDGFEFRDDDIVIDTWAKSGTTWTQQIVSQ